MEIRNALQKIENYLTVVSNLNKTILSEGTMSKDELLLMKKYLYTSIDRVEDIERLLVIDKSQEKSFTPSVTADQVYVAPKSKEIVAVEENNFQEVAEFNLIQETDNSVENIITEDFSVDAVQEALVEVAAPVIENIITEDFSVDAVQEVLEVEAAPVIENIIAEDFSVDAVHEALQVEAAPVIENIITEDFSVDAVHEALQIEAAPVIENIITEDFSVDAVHETIVEQFVEHRATTFAEEMEFKKKEEKSLFEDFSLQLNATPQKQLFELFDQKEETADYTFEEPTAKYEPLKINFDYSDTSGSGTSVLVAEKEVETITEELTPSFLNQLFTPELKSENNVRDLSKTFSESIALNDKFIFVRELFGNQFAEYELSLKQLDKQSSFSSAEKYCKDNLWSKFNWSEKGAVADRFMELLQRRF